MKQASRITVLERKVAEFGAVAAGDLRGIAEKTTRKRRQTTALALALAGRGEERRAHGRASEERERGFGRCDVWLGC